MASATVNPIIQKPISDNTQQKLLLLFVFDKMEMALSAETIFDFCTSTNTWLNYMDCHIAFDQLLQTGFICKVNHKANDKLLYTITEEGRICLAHFFPRLPSSVREDISKRVKEQRMIFKRKQEYFSDYVKNPDGSYKVILRISEPDTNVLDITLNVPSREIATQIFEHWEEKAPDVFQSVYDILVE